jgi:hypothetical protein
MEMNGTRVRVHSGDGSTLLGDGWYVGDVDVFFIRHSDGHLTSAHDAEKPPPLEEIPTGAQLVKSENNPKIKLDNGDVVYGCQVWWEPIEEPTGDLGWRR